MAVLDRSELEASSLADLHAIADQLGLEGFRRLRKAELIDTILAGPGSSPAAEEQPGVADEQAAQEGPRASRRAPRRPSLRGRRLRRGAREEEEEEETAAAEVDEGAATAARASQEQDKTLPGGEGERRASAPPAAGKEAVVEAEEPQEESREGGGELGSAGTARARARRRPSESPAREPRGVRSRRGAAERPGREEREAEGVVELLGNGSAFLRIDPPEVSQDDVYISAAQVRRCELVSGDRVSGPVRAPRRSERYSALVRVETINGAPAGEIAEGGRYEDRPVAYPSERLGLDGADTTLQAIEWLTPFGRGSRVLIVGPARAGKTEILRRLLDALATDRGSASEGLEVTVVLAGVRPEEVAQWSEGPVEPAVGLTFAASADSQGQAVEHALETAKRTAARGGDALVLIDTLDGLHPHVARRVMAAARNISDGGSLTILATATRPLGGETTVIALDPALALAGGPPLELAASGTVRPELLVGEDGAAAIAQARANALTGS